MWTQFCESGDPGCLSGLPRDVAESWIRSRRGGVDPGLEHFPLPDSQPTWSDDEAQLLGHTVRAVRPFLKEVEECGALLAIISASGRIVFRHACQSTLHEADRIGSVPGAMTLEAAAGTNSAGTTLHLGQVTHVERWQHFCEAFWHWSDIGAPIVHPRNGALLGMVDLGMCRGTITPALTLAIKAIARAIELDVLELEAELQRAVLKNWSCLPQRDGGGTLALDRHGTILCADRSTRRLLAGGRALTADRYPALDLPPEVLGSRERGTHTLLIGEQETTLDIEPTLLGEKLAGSIVHLRTPNSTPARSTWQARHALSDIIGSSPAVRRAVELAGRLARTDLPILLHAETGSGKELLAHAIHMASARASGPFVTVNCGAVPPDLIASELFGYEKGAFTGANRGGLRGKFELADGGTLFLDEVTETGSAFQVSLLRAIQDSAVVPVGAEVARPVDVRIISATNREPAEAVEDGNLRRDLFYRLNGTLITLPPLRERRGDIPELVRHFCSSHAEGVGISDAALEILVAHDWPGNVRELESVMRTAAALCGESRIEPEHLPDSVPRISGTTSSPSAHGTLADTEAAAIERAITHCGGDVRQAAALLGIGRSTLYRKLQRLNLKRSTWS